ncbi:hypothetical protein [Bradyrhizobium sp. HKCCYLS20291]|uniref:hypothetical protein n=1 Tax=Bradyrhizobium sp. HKCCYLS20291 TaxID=3420766 RepID=UPI003EB79002
MSEQKAEPTSLADHGMASAEPVLKTSVSPDVVDVAAPEIAPVAQGLISPDHEAPSADRPAIVAKADAPEASAVLPHAKPELVVVEDAKVEAKPEVDAGKPQDAKSQDIKSQDIKPQDVKPQAVKADPMAAETAALKPGKPEAGKPELKRLDLVKSDKPSPDVAKSETSRTDAIKAGAAKPNPSKAVPGQGAPRQSASKPSTILDLIRTEPVRSDAIKTVVSAGEMLKVETPKLSALAANAPKIGPMGSAKPEPASKPEPAVKPEPVAKPEPAVRSEVAVKPETSSKPATMKPDAPVKPETVVKPEPVAKVEVAMRPEVAAKAESVAKPEPAVTPEPAMKSEPIVKPEAAVKTEAVARPPAAPPAAAFDPASKAATAAAVVDKATAWAKAKFAAEPPKVAAEPPKSAAAAAAATSQKPSAPPSGTTGPAAGRPPQQPGRAAPSRIPLVGRLGGLPTIAATVLLAMVVGGVAGSLVTATFVDRRGTDTADAGGAATDATLSATVSRIENDVASLKASLEQTNQTSLVELNKSAERLDRLEKILGELSTKASGKPSELQRLSDAVERLRAAQASAQGNAASRDTTGSVPQAVGAINAAAPPVGVASRQDANRQEASRAEQARAEATRTESSRAEAARAEAAARADAARADANRPKVVEGWVLRDVGRGGALIEGRGGLYEVYAGDPVPGLGKVDAIKKQDGRWVVYTTKGLVVAR